MPTWSPAFVQFISHDMIPQTRCRKRESMKTSLTQRSGFQ